MCVLIYGQAASERGRLASPSCEEATWDQLEVDVVKDLLAEGKGYAVQVWPLYPHDTISGHASREPNTEYEKRLLQ